MSAVVLVILLLGVITSTASPGFKVVGPDGPVVGVVGEDLVLPCFLKPNTSAVDMDVVWLTGEYIVHHYRRHQDTLVQQLPDYRDRTSLFRDELAKGNVSLKLRSVRPSDANTYRCYIAAETGTDEAPVHVSVEAVGSTPVISTESLGNGSVSLLCESTDWLPQPQLEWMDGKDRILSAEPTVLHSDTKGFTIKSKVTVQQSDGTSFLCRVSNQRQTKDKKITVPKPLFGWPRHHWAPVGSILLFLSGCALGYYHSRGIHLYKQWVISKFTWPHDSHLPGNDIKTYTELHIIQRHRTTIITERLRGTDRSPVSKKDYKRITLSELFSPDKDETPPNVVVLKGYSGYGKSITTRKIICDWASGMDYTKMFDLVVLLRCKELNMEGGMSLLELVSCPQRFRSVMEAVLKDAPHKVLIIIDGFDELKKSAPKPSSHLPSQPFTRAPPADTIQALLGGHILPESFLLVTTRHTAADRLREMLEKREERFTEILGFSQNMVKDYFNKFFENQREAKQAYENVEKIDFLLSSCYTPLRCWMICLVLKKTSLELETRTSMYIMFVITLLKDINMPNSEVLKMLAKLAKEGTWRKKFLFEKDKVSGLDKIPLLQRINTRRQVLYSFVHQSVQEFFTALYFIIIENDDMQSEVKKLLDSVKGPSAAENMHVFPIIRILFGFSNAEVQPSLSSLTQRSPLLTNNRVKYIRDLLQTQILEQVDEFMLKYVRMFILHCLFEIHDKETVRCAMERWKKIDFSSFAIKWEDCWALRFCLQSQPNIACLNISNCNLRADTLKLLAPAMAELSCKALWVDVEDLSDADDLASALGTGGVLTRLRVENSQLSDESVQQILSALRNQESVGSVYLSVKTVSLDMANRLIEHVCSVTVTGIMSITLSGKEPHDRDGDHLCSSLCVGKDQHSFIVSLGHDGILQPAVSELSVTLPSSWDMKHWTELLQHFQQLRELKNKSEVDYNALDERVKNLVSLLHSLPGLQKVYLKANIQTIQWAFEVYSLIHKCATLQEIDVMVRELEEEHGEPAHSFLSVRKDQDSTVRLTVGQHILRPSLTPHENSPLSLISVTFPDSEVPSKRWVDFLKNFDTLSRNRTAHMEDLKEDIKGLFSTLLSVSGLREVELRVGNLTETWAQHIISLIRKQPRDKEISVNALKECGNQEESLCSSLYVTNKNSNFRLAVEHLSQGNSTPALSYISVVTDSHDKQMNQMDWTKYLKMFHTLKRELESVYVHEYAEPLLSVLRSLSALREVEFRVSCLTEVWAGLMLSLLQDCTGLQKMRLSAGRAVVSEGLSVCSEYGPLLLDNINHLKESLKDTHCTVTLIGIKRRTVEMSSHFREGRLQCNRPVKITIKGRKYTEELLDQ